MDAFCFGFARKVRIMDSRRGRAASKDAHKGCAICGNRTIVTTKKCHCRRRQVAMEKKSGHEMRMASCYRQHRLGTQKHREPTLYSCLCRGLQAPPPSLPHRHASSQRQQSSPQDVRREGKGPGRPTKIASSCNCGVLEHISTPSQPKYRHMTLRASRHVGSSAFIPEIEGSR